MPCSECTDIRRELAEIKMLLERLVSPVVAEEARQQLNCTDEQRKAHNKELLERSRKRRKLLQMGKGNA